MSCRSGERGAERDHVQQDYLLDLKGWSFSSVGFTDEQAHNIGGANGIRQDLYASTNIVHAAAALTGRVGTGLPHVVWPVFHIAFTRFPT